MAPNKLLRLFIATALFSTLITPLHATEPNRGEKDLFFDTDNSDSRNPGSGCRIGVSPIRNNMVMFDSLSSPAFSGYRVFTSNKRFEMENTYVFPPGFEYTGFFTGVVSDSGPLPHINVAFFVSRPDGTTPQLHFSKDSGKTFQAINFPNVAPYLPVTNFDQSFPHGSGLPYDFMKFGPDGNLYVVYITRGPRHPQYSSYFNSALNLIVVNTQGEIIHHEILTEIVEVPAKELTYFINTIILNTGKLIVAYKPYKLYMIGGGEREGAPGLIVYDTNSRSKNQEISWGVLPLGAENEQETKIFNRPVSNPFYSPIITTDGTNVFLMHNFFPKKVIINSVEQSLGDAKIRKFSSTTGDNSNFLFPVNDQINNLLDINILEGGILFSSLVSIPTNAAQHPKIYGFAAPRHPTGADTGEVDIIYDGYDPHIGDIDWYREYVHRVRFKPDIGLPSALFSVLNDYDPSNISSIRKQGVFILEGPKDSSFVSGPNSTVASFCERFTNTNPEVEDDPVHFVADQS